MTAARVFNILPRFVYNNEAEIQQSHADEAQLMKFAINNLKVKFVADEWLQNVSHVRPKVARWDYVRTLHEALNNDVLLLRPVQLPYRAKDSWVAVEFPETDELDPTQPFNIAHDTLSIAIHGEAAFVPVAKQCGLLIDEWTEVIPTKEEVTGITFNYNQPNATPPQALLLAVTPEEKGNWTWDSPGRHPQRHFAASQAACRRAATVGYNQQTGSKCSLTGSVGGFLAIRSQHRVGLPPQPGLLCASFAHLVGFESQIRVAYH